jgi:hypothetical protein
LTLAGQPSRIGGLLASASGWVVLVIGLSIATFLGLLLQSFFPNGYVGWAFAIPTAVLSLFIGLTLLFTGRRLKRHGVDARRRVQFAAVRALAAHHAGSITAEQTAAALNLSEAEADVLLTELAKEPKENVSLDVDDDGQIHFLFGVAEKRWRVLEESAAARGAPAVDAEPVEDASAPPEERARR